MSNRHARSIAGIAFLTALLLIACGDSALADATIPLSSADRAQLDKYLGAGVVGDPVAATALLAAEKYLPPQGTAMSYRVLEADEKPRTETHKVEKTSDPQFAPGWRYVADPIGAIFIQNTSDGGAVLAGEQDFEEKVLSRFTPGQPLVIAGLMPGEGRRVTVKVAVSDLSDPTEIDHEGSLDITYTYLGAYKVTVPAGSFEAALIRWDYKGSVGPADIEETLYRFIAPGAGMVAMVDKRHISAMLIYNDKTKLGKLLEARR
jgi:hypothetical protein